MNTNTYSGLATLISALANLADDKLKDLPSDKLKVLESCCDTAITTLAGIQSIAALGLMQMTPEEQQSNNIPYLTQDFMITAAETFQELHSLASELNFYIQQKQAQ